LAKAAQEPSDAKKLRFIKQRLKSGHFLPTQQDIEQIKKLSAQRIRPSPENQAEQRQSSPEEAQSDAIGRLYEMANRGLVHSELAFCMLDVVGFGDLLESSDAFALYQDVITPFLETSSTELENAVKLLSIPFRKHHRRPRLDMTDLPRLEALLFADTVVLYPAFTSRVPQVYRERPVQVWLLVEAARNLIMNFFGRRLLIRGSIAYGECLITRDPICYLGRPIMEAHSIETAQNWGGVTLAPSAAITMQSFKALPRQLCRCKVPWKTTRAAQEALNRHNCSATGDHYVIDWSFYGLCNDDVIRWLDEQAEAADNEHVRELYANTAAFFRARRRADDAGKP